MEGSKIYDPRQQIVESLSDNAIAARFNHFRSFSQTDWGRPEWRKSHQKVVFFFALGIYNFPTLMVKRAYISTTSNSAQWDQVVPGGATCTLFPYEDREVGVPNFGQ